MNTLLCSALIFSQAILCQSTELIIEKEKHEIPDDYGNAIQTIALCGAKCQHTASHAVFCDSIRPDHYCLSDLALYGNNYMDLDAGHLAVIGAPTRELFADTYNKLLDNSHIKVTHVPLKSRKLFYDFSAWVYPSNFKPGTPPPILTGLKENNTQWPCHITSSRSISNKPQIYSHNAQAIYLGLQLSIAPRIKLTRGIFSFILTQSNIINLITTNIITPAANSKKTESSFLSHISSTPNKYFYRTLNHIQQDWQQQIAASIFRPDRMILAISSLRYYSPPLINSTLHISKTTHYSPNGIYPHKNSDLQKAHLPLRPNNSLLFKSHYKSSFIHTLLSTLFTEYSKVIFSGPMFLQSSASNIIHSIFSANFNIRKETNETRHNFALDVDTTDTTTTAGNRTINIPEEDTDNLIVISRQQSDLAPKYLLALSIASISMIVLILYQRQIIRRLRARKHTSNMDTLFSRNLFNEVPHPIYIRDRNGLLLDCNDQYLEALGVERHDVINKTAIGSTCFKGTQHQSQMFHNEYLKVMETGIASSLDRTVQTIDGHTIIINHWIHPYKDAHGEVLGIVAGWVDITECHRLLESLKDAKEHSDDASRAKSEFLATMSHEIRTPMNAVLGMLELALKKANQGVVDRISIEIAFNAAQELLDLIGDILDISRIESGRLALNPSRTNLKKLVEGTARVFETSARQKGLSLILDFNLPFQYDVMLDSLRFKQIISNLLSNAIKFTLTGEIRIEVSGIENLAKNRMSLQVFISDTGIGISEDDQTRLFNPFVQSNVESHSSLRGSGLGLMICRTLCEMMQGHLSLQSQLGKGTSIQIALELEILSNQPQANLPAHNSDVQTRQLKILVVDDYPANRLLISHQLGYLGHLVIDVEDGTQGLEEWRNGDFDIVITDCNMPLMNGYNLARAIREDEFKKNHARCVIIGLTANAQPGEKRRCTEAGMDECLFKPISLGDLAASLLVTTARYHASATVKPEPKESKEEIDLTNLQMMMGYDDMTTQKLLTELINSTEDDISRLTTLQLHYDLSGLADLAHRIKGGARIISAKNLVRCCDELEASCIGFDPVRLSQAVDALQTAMQQLVKALKKNILRLKHTESDL